MVVFVIIFCGLETQQARSHVEFLPALAFFIAFQPPGLGGTAGCWSADKVEYGRKRLDVKLKMVHLSVRRGRPESDRVAAYFEPAGAQSLHGIVSLSS